MTCLVSRDHYPYYLVTAITGQGLWLLVNVIAIQHLKRPKVIILPVPGLTLLLPIPGVLASIPLNSVNSVNELRLRARGRDHLLEPHPPPDRDGFTVIVKWIWELDLDSLVRRPLGSSP